MLCHLSKCTVLKKLKDNDVGKMIIDHTRKLRSREIEVYLDFNRNYNLVFLDLKKKIVCLFFLIKLASELTRLTRQPVVGRVGSGSNFVGSLISEPGWVDPLSGQPVAGRAELGRVTRFDSSSIVTMCF